MLFSHWKKIQENSSCDSSTDSSDSLDEESDEDYLLAIEACNQEITAIVYKFIEDVHKFTDVQVTIQITATIHLIIIFLISKLRTVQETFSGDS